MVESLGSEWHFCLFCFCFCFLMVRLGKVAFEVVIFNLRTVKPEQSAI